MCKKFCLNITKKVVYIALQNTVCLNQVLLAESFLDSTFIIVQGLPIQTVRNKFLYKLLYKPT